MSKITIHDVARAAGVSTATVSRVMSKKSNVGDAYIERVMAAAHRLEYRPQFAASVTRSGKSGIIAMLMPRLDLEIFSSIADGAVQKAAQLGRMLLLMSSEGSSQVERERLAQLASLPIDGLIYRPVTLPSSFDNIRSQFNIPIVGIDLPSAAESTLPGILSPAFESGYVAARYLLRLGRHRIAFMAAFRENNVTNPAQFHALVQANSQEVSVQRFQGILHAFDEAGLSFDPQNLLFCPYTQKGGHEAAASVISQNLSANALICANDEAALGALSFFREQGIRIPEQISLVGFDNSSICHAMQPSLTSIDYHSFETGQTTVTMLDSILKRDSLSVEQITIPITLVIRSSSCAPTRSPDIPR